ncbi:MAG TPA: citrate/2-methylcitrate synthase [Acidimicrobiales bacterium]|nr:citrate/2-methylcitrate synthase [Acidimicrobiales bacterium]
MPTTPTVATAMTEPVVTAGPDETLEAAARRMHEHRIGAVVVVDGNRPVGIVTERDLLRATAAGTAPATAVVRDWMAPDPECVATDTSIDQAWQQLADRGYRHIPVVVGDELKGIVSLRDLMALAQLRPAGETAATAPPGLKGVVVAETSLGDVRGGEGFYHYRQYAAPELAAKRTFEDVWQLLVDGTLPTPGERRAFAAEVAPLRALPPAVLDALPHIAAHTPAPVAALRTAISLLAGVEDVPASLDVARDRLRADALRLSAAVPTIIAAVHRVRHGLAPIAPRDDLPYAANYLYMIDGAEPAAARARAIEQYLILGVDHGFNASTFVARAVTSTGADLGAVVVAALGSLSGPLHGGSPSRALDTLDAIGRPERSAAWVRDAVAAGDRIMGFGHAVYRTADPRSTMMRSVAEGLGGDLVALATEVEAEILRTLAELKPGRALNTNIEWYAAVVMDRCGLPRDLFTPTFAASRVIGWCAHALEQHADNRIIRPSSRYVGPPPPQPVPEA